MDIRQTAKLSMHNRSTLEKAQRCGCYHCCEIFMPADITNYTDANDTALCPHCQVDAILPETADVPLSKEALKTLNNYWF